MRNVIRMVNQLVRCALGYGADNSLDNLVREEIVLATFYIWIFPLAVVSVRDVGSLYA